MLQLRTARITGRTVLIRASLDVPLSKRGLVADSFRLQHALPTLRYCIQKRSRLVLLGHHGQPHGRRLAAHSLRPVSKALAALLRCPVAFADLAVAERARQRLAPGGVLMLENLRFYPGEEHASLPFAKKLAALGDLYVNDDFSTAHRAHASMTVLPTLLPAYAGMNVLAELKALGSVRDHPNHPFIVVIGGGKVADKFSVMTALLPKADALLLGGAGALTLLWRRGGNVGKSIVDAALPARVVKQALRSRRVIMPVDWRVAHTPDSKPSVVALNEIPHDAAAYDIGPATISHYCAILRTARTVLWSGPMGLYEYPAFANGTRLLARNMPRKALTVAGGGDTLAAIHATHAARRFHFLSTAGSAMLQYLAGKPLPALQALEKNHRH